MQSLPPLFSTIQEQTGITPPGWLVRMPEQADQRQRNDEQKQVNGNDKALTNGHGKRQSASSSF